MAEVPSNPGSYKEFVKAQGLEMSIGALTLWSGALASYRVELAAAKNISLEELHTMPQPKRVEEDAA